MNSVRISVAAVAGLVLLGAAPSAEARLSCSFSGPPENVLTVTASGFGAYPVIRRSGDLIQVSRPFGSARNCGGDDPTVFNTDSIRVLLRHYAESDLRLDGGPFAPGATPEPDGESEIEVEFDGFVVLPSVVGTAAAEEFQWGPGGSNPGLNLNPRTANHSDVDVDVTVKGKYSSLIADGAGGDDKIVPAPGFASRSYGLFSKGGKGSDLIIAPPNTGGVLEGGPGDDHVTGSRLRDYLIGGDGHDHLRAGAGDDLISGGHGADLIFGGPGPDRINAKHFDRDTVRCGAGRDRVKADRRDQLRGCEKVRR